MTSKSPKKVAQGRPGYCRVAAMNSASMTPQLVLRVTIFHHFRHAFIQFS